MIKAFDDFCLYVYAIVDDLVLEMQPLFKRPGPKPICTDSELIAMVLISECKRWDVETELLSNWRSHQDMFPHIPSQSRFNRRRRNLMWMTNWVRRKLLLKLDDSLDNQCIIDSLPVPVVQFHGVPPAIKNWGAYQADFGKVSSKKQTIFGYKLHILVTLGGLILDFSLAPASVTDLKAGWDIFSEHTDKDIIGDKAYISAAEAATLWEINRIRLMTLPRKNQKVQLSKRMRRLFNSVRQMIETVNGQLNEQFQIETNHAHTFQGLCARLYSKLTAHTLCMFMNRELGNESFLKIKSLAFPN